MQISITKGYNINIAGRPADTIEEVQKPETVGVLPEHIPFIKPRLRVKEGDHVRIGTPLFEDKRNPDIIFVSPGAGIVDAVNYGKRRVIKEIIIALDAEEEKESFPVILPDDIDRTDRSHIIDILMRGGLWPMIRELPYRDIANHKKEPPSIVISLDSADYFQPASACYLKGEEELFLFGLDIMKRLSDTVYISANSRNTLPGAIQGTVTHLISGKYPADDPGVLVYHIRKKSEENAAWYINGQDLLLIASLVRHGSYPTKKMYTVAGSGTSEKRHVKARIGSPVSSISGVSESATNKLRYVAGGVLKGYTLPCNSYMGYYESSVTLLPEGAEEEFFGFIRPGFKRQSYSRTFLSFFNRSGIEMNCNTHGESRACINCGTCEQICPVDILPQYTLKCLHADEIEEALAHGLLDCVECGLCTYVCPSKIEINQIMKQAKADYYKERA